MTEDSSEPSDPQTQPQRPADGARSSPAFRLWLLVALVVLLLGSTALVGYLAATRAVPEVGIGGEQAELQQQREDVMSRARQFMLRVNTYGPEDLDANGEMPEYRQGVEELLTPKFAESFNESVTAAEQTVSQAGLARVAEVFSAGVSAIDSDSATVLVAGAFTNSYPDPENEGERIQDEPAPYRVQVKMVKIDGQWLVDDFSPLTGEAPPTGEGQQ